VFNHHLYNCFFIFLFIFFVSGCSQSDDQRKFEQEAFQLPEGITQTNGRGQVVNDNVDPDDWRVAPFFQGVVQVDPAYPNPVLTNDRVTLDIHITGLDAVSGIQIHALHNINQLSPTIYSDNRSPIPPGLLSISINPLNIPQTPENPQGRYRIIVFDRNYNVITYGDIEIE